MKPDLLFGVVITFFVSIFIFALWYDNLNAISRESFQELNFRDALYTSITVQTLVGLYDTPRTNEVKDIIMIQSIWAYFLTAVGFAGIFT